MKGQKCGWVGTGWCVTNSEIGKVIIKKIKKESGGGRGVQEVKISEAAVQKQSWCGRNLGK